MDVCVYINLVLFPVLVRNACTLQQWPFYGPLSGTSRVSRCQKRTSLWCNGRLIEADT